MSQPADTSPVPRGRHAPPLEVRLTVQRERLFAAAAEVFAKQGYADASAEAIARAAGMSKATFYEHFANKEEAILALFDEAASVVLRSMADAAGESERATSYEAWVRDGLRAFLRQLAEHPQAAQTLLVEIIGAGPRAMERRDAIMDAFAEGLFQDNLAMAPRFGAPVFAAREDAFAVIGAITEVVSRHLRTRGADRIAEAEPALLRVIFGVLGQGEAEGLGGR